MNIPSRRAAARHAPDRHAPDRHAQTRPAQGRTVAAVIVCLGLLAAALLASCSGDSEGARASSDKKAAVTTTAPPLEFSRWSGLVDSSCADLNTTFAVLGDADPTNAAEAIEYAEQVDEFAEGILDSVISVGEPIGQESGAAELVEDLRALTSATGQLARTAESGDAEGADAAAARIATLGATINPLATELGVPSCGGF